MPPTVRAPSLLLQRLLMGLLCAIWGSTYLAIRFGLEDLPPLRSAAARFLVAWAVMLVLAPLLARREGGARPGLGLVLALGAVNVGAGYAILYHCETVVPSGLASVLFAVFPLLLAVAAHFFLPGERLRPRQLLGFLLGFAGVAFLFRNDLAAIAPEAVPMGALLLLSPLANVFGTIVLKRHGGGASSVLLNRDGMLVGGLLLAGAALALEDGSTTVWSRRAVLSVLYLALVGTVLAFTIYYWLLRHAPASELSLIAYVIPAIALTLGALVGGEPVSATTLQGSAIVLAGVALASRPGSRSRAGASAAPRPTDLRLDAPAEAPEHAPGAAPGSTRSDAGAPMG